MTDFLVIGGGIAGISAAARLAPLGSVTVLEAETALGYHASGRSAAMYEENYGKPAVRALNSASRSYHERIGSLSPRGIMMIGSKSDEEAFAADLKEFDLQVMSPSEAKEIVPILNTDVVIQAGLSTDAMDLDTDLLLQSFAREARTSGEIITNTRARKITKTGSGWAVETDGGTHEGRILINAAGAWVDQVATMAGAAPLGFQPYRRSFARLPAPGDHDVGSWPMLFGAGESWYAKPDAGKWLVSPADEDPTDPHDAWADDMVLAEGIARYSEYVTEEVTRLETSWAGLRTFAPDRQLVIGFDPDIADFFWVAGQGGYGMQSSPAASQLAADLIAGRPSELGSDVVAQLSPARFTR